jgi:capsular polysaccharide biosynthesis protein
MEIRDYLRAIRRVLWLLILIPVVAGLATGGLMEIQPSAYEADATVVVPAITANGFSQSAASQYVDTFKDVLVSPPVLLGVSQKYPGISTSELASGLSASTITTSSNIIHVVLIGKDHQNLTGAVSEATVVTLDTIAGPRLKQAQSAAANSATLLQNADAAITNWIASTGNAAPQSEFDNIQTQLNAQVAILATEEINNDVKREASTKALIAEYKAELVTYGNQLGQYEALDNARNAAISASDHATQEVVDAQALVTTDSAPGTVTTVNVGRLSKLSNTIKFAGIAFALALVMMLGLLLILELMRSGRRVAVVEAPEQGAFAWNAQSAAATPPETASAPPPTSAPPAQTERRDPWRASPAATAAGAVTGGNGDGNGIGHANGNGNGNGHADVAEVEADPQRRGLLRRG